MAARHIMACLLPVAASMQLPAAKQSLSAIGSFARARAPQPRLDLLSEYREEAAINSIAEKPVMFDDDGSFDFKRWELHRSRSRYGRELIGILFGSTTRRVLPIVLLIVAFSFAVDYYNTMATTQFNFIDPDSFGLPPGATSRFLPEIQLPITPFELTSPVLGLLLVFRTDTANDRFNHGTDSAWEVTSSMRSYIRRLLAWTGGDAASEEERDAARDLISSSLMLHGWIMGSYLRGDEVAERAGMARESTSQAQLISQALGVSAEELDGMGSSPSLTPSLALSSISLGVSQRLPSLTDQERIALDDELAVVTCALAKCEKMLRTPIPLGYTRYSVRFLWIWLTLLPFALVRTFKDFGVDTWWADKPQPVVVLAMFFIGFIFLSIEDIAVQIEEPFAILPLELHQRYLEKDVEEAYLLMDWSKKRRLAQQQQAGQPTVDQAAVRQSSAGEASLGTSAKKEAGLLGSLLGNQRKSSSS